MSKIKAIEKFVGNLPDNVRIHISKKQITKLRSVPQKGDGFKPNGIWYDCDKEWMDWVGSEMPDWVSDYIYLVEIKKSKMLRLKSEKDVREFDAEYGHSGRMSIMGGNSEVDWKRVASKYAGIEICPYIGSLRMDSQVSWYYPWDIASGCIWNPAGVKLKFVGLWNDKTKEVLSKNEIIEMEKQAGLQQPLSRRRDYGTAEDGSMMAELERMHEADRVALAGDLTGMAKEIVAYGEIEIDNLGYFSWNSLPWKFKKLKQMRGWKSGLGGRHGWDFTPEDGRDVKVTVRPNGLTFKSSDPHAPGWAKSGFVSVEYDKTVSWSKKASGPKAMLKAIAEGLSEAEKARPKSLNYLHDKKLISSVVSIAKKLPVTESFELNGSHSKTKEFPLRILYSSRYLHGTITITVGHDSRKGKTGISVVSRRDGVPDAFESYDLNRFNASSFSRAMKIATEEVFQEWDDIHGYFKAWGK